MRAKTLLLTAALSAAGMISAVAADNVYSVNVVGYINVGLASGYTMIANQLDDGKGNKVVALLPTPPEDTWIYKYNPASGGYDILHFIDAAWEGDNLDLTLAPGEGVFAYVNTAATFTFVGEVKQSQGGAPLTVSLPQGYAVASSIVPQAGKLQTDLKYAPAEDDWIYQFDPATGGYKVNHFIDAAWEGDNNGDEPSIKVGESFFVFGAAAKQWSRVFTVN
jgi:hypothetical protein